MKVICVLGLLGAFMVISSCAKPQVVEKKTVIIVPKKAAPEKAAPDYWGNLEAQEMDKKPAN